MAVLLASIRQRVVVFLFHSQVSERIPPPPALRVLRPRVPATRQGGGTAHAGLRYSLLLLLVLELPAAEDCAGPVEPAVASGEHGERDQQRPRQRTCSERDVGGLHGRVGVQSVVTHTIGVFTLGDARFETQVLHMFWG